MLRQAQRRRGCPTASSATIVDRSRAATAATVLTFVSAFARCNAASVHNGYAAASGAGIIAQETSADDEREREWELVVEGQSESRDFSVLVDVWLVDYEESESESKDGTLGCSSPALPDASTGTMQRPRLPQAGRLVGKLASGIRTGSTFKVATPLRIVEGSDDDQDVYPHVSSPSPRSYRFRITAAENSSRILYESHPLHTIPFTNPIPSTLATPGSPPIEDSLGSPSPACSSSSIDTSTSSPDCGVSLTVVNRRQFGGGGFGGGGFGGGGFGGGTGGFGTGGDTGGGGFPGGGFGTGGFGGTTGGGSSSGGGGSSPVNSQPSQPQASNPPQNSPQAQPNTQSPAQGTSPSNSNGGGGGSQPPPSPNPNSGQAFTPGSTIMTTIIDPNTPISSPTALGQGPSTKTATVTTDIISTVVGGGPSSASSGSSSSSSSSSGSASTGATGTKLVRKKPTATISGAALGGAVVLITILIVLVILYRRRRSARRSEPDTLARSGLGRSSGNGRLGGWRSGGERYQARVESFREDKRAWDAEWNGANGGGKHGNAEMFSQPLSDRSSSLQGGSSEAIAGTTIGREAGSLRRSQSVDRDTNLKSKRRRGSRGHSGRTSSARRASSSTTAHLRSLSESMSISGSASIGSTLRDHHASLTSTLYGPEPSPGSDSGLKSSSPFGPGLAPPNTPATPPHLPISPFPPPPIPISSINASTHPHLLQPPPQRRHSESNSLSASSDIGLLPIAPSKNRRSRRGTDASSSTGHQDFPPEKEKTDPSTGLTSAQPIAMPAPVPLPAPAPAVVRYSTPASSNVNGTAGFGSSTRGTGRGHNSYSHPHPHPLPHPSHAHSLTSSGVLAPISSSPFSGTGTGTGGAAASRGPPLLSLAIAEDRFSDEFGGLEHGFDIDALSIGYTSAPTTARPPSSRPPLPEPPASAPTTTGRHTSMNTHLSTTSAAIRIPPRPPTPPPTPPFEHYAHNRRTIEVDGMSVFTIPDDPPPQYRRTLIQPLDIPLPDSAHPSNHHPQHSRFTAPP